MGTKRRSYCKNIKRRRYISLRNIYYGCFVAMDLYAQAVDECPGWCHNEVDNIAQFIMLKPKRSTLTKKSWQSDLWAIDCSLATWELFPRKASSLKCQKLFHSQVRVVRTPFTHRSQFFLIIFFRKVGMFVPFFFTSSGGMYTFLKCS